MSEEDYKKVFSKNLKYFMEQKGISQMDLVNDLQLSQSTVSNWCTGLKLPRMNKIQMLADYFGIEKSDLLERKTSSDSQLSSKDEKDIEKALQDTLNQLESEQNGLMFSGQALDDETRELLKISLENSLRMAKITAKKKFTPKKYRADEEEPLCHRFKRM